MEINLLALNLGNSRLAIANFVGASCANVVRIPHGERGNWEAAFARVGRSYLPTTVRQLLPRA